MIYQPRNVQPSGVSIDGLLDNTFTMEIQTNSYVSAYQLLIVDFDNNEIYTGSKTTLTNYAYNGDILEIPVSASAVALSNGANYKWRVRLYQPTADMLITYGLVQATSTTTTIYLQPNINIKAGMAITINSQTKTISSYNSDTGVAVVGSAFSSAPAVGTQYKIYSDFIETVPDYIVYARRTPAVAISNVPSSLTLKYHTFQGTYTQSDNVPIVYHQFDLYTRNDDGTTSLVASSDKVYSANLSYTYDSFRTGNKYLIQMTVENDMGIISTTDMYEFNVSYDIVEYLQQPLASFDDKNNAVKVSWVTPVENEATSFRSDVATGIIQDNNNTLTQATFEPGQSIGEGDVVQITNSDCELVIDGKSTQATRSGKNLFNKSITPIIASNGQTFTELDTGVKISYTNSSSSNVVKYAMYKLIDLTNYIGKVVRIKCDFSKSNEILAPRYCIGLCDVNGNNGTKESVSITSGETISFTVPTLDGTSIYLCVWLYCTYISPIEKGDYVDFTDIIITMDNEDMTYEPYTGGQPSPSPDYPSEIESVKGKNLFNINGNRIDYNATSSIINDTLKIIASGNYARTDYLNIEIPKTAHTISFNWESDTSLSGTDARIYVYDGATVGTMLTYSNLVGVSGKVSLTFTNTTGVISIRFSPNNTATSKTITMMLTNIQLEKGSVATSYLPYNTIEVKSTGKNLYNYSFMRPSYSIFTNNNDGSFTLNGSISNNQSYSLTSSSKVYLTPNTYTISINDYLSNGSYIYLYNSTSGKYLTTEIGKSLKSFTFTITENSYLSFTLVLISGDYSNSTYYIMLNEGSTALDYEPYKSSSSLFVLDQPLRSLPNGVKDELVIENGRAKIIKRVGTVVLDGSENWNNIQEATTSTDYYYAYTIVYDKLIGSKYTGISNNFIVKQGTYITASSTVDSDMLGVGGTGNGKIRMFIKKSRLTEMTTAELKTWLSTHNTQVDYELATPTEIDLGDGVVPYIDGINYMHISSNMDTTFSLVYPHKTISGNAYDYTEFNPPGVKQTGTIKSYNAITGIGTLMPQYPFMYTPMQGDSYAVISNIYNVSGFSYLYNTPYNTVNSLYTHGYTATWATPDGLCVLPDDFNITLQFSPDGNFFYDQNGVYQEVVNLITTETDDANNEGEFTIKIDKNKLIFVQKPDISLELPFYTNTTQVFVLSPTSVAQINNDYVWDDTATWTDTYTWVEGGTSLERVCNHWWKVQITNTGIKIEEIFPTT
jgi:hypothetical protein